MLYLQRLLLALSRVTKSELFAYVVITLTLLYAVGFYLAFYHRVMAGIMRH